jgi:hypothetical protein
MNPRLSALLFATFLGLGPSPAHSQRPAPPVPTLDCVKPLTLDVATQSVVGIRLDVPDSVLVASLPPRSVRRHVKINGADTVVTFTITLCGHVLELGWNGISTTDPAFITTEGLHVGLPIAQFDAWGKGQLLWSEAGWMMYFFQKVSINAGVDACVSPQPVLSQPCVATAQWRASGFPRPGG